MILYVNGCSHTAAAEAVVPDCFAVDDGKHGIDRRPHPLNLAASWCTHLAKATATNLICQAESGSSNDRIMRTTREWIANNPFLIDNTTFVIQWSTWEREEWLHRGIYYQVNASGIDWLPNELHSVYKKFISNIDWQLKTQQAHEKIWHFHQELASKKIKHVFFNGHSTFATVTNQMQWHHCYINPYDANGSFYEWLKRNGGSRSRPNSYHYDAKSHRLWANYMLQYLDRNHILRSVHEIPID
jgi:hypothetical protein